MTLLFDSPALSAAVDWLAHGLLGLAWWQVLLIGLVLKLLVMPALAVPISLAFGMPALMFKANVLESAMPTMISAAALAMAPGLAPRLSAALVGYGIVLSLLTLPAWAWLLGRMVS